MSFYKRSTTTRRRARILRLARSGAVLLTTISASLVSGCGLNPGQRIVDAGKDKGVSQAQILLPDWPVDCKTHTPKTPLTVGMDPLAADKLDRHQIDVANRKVDHCADHYAELQQLIAQATTPAK